MRFSDLLLSNLWSFNAGKLGIDAEGISPLTVSHESGENPVPLLGTPGFDAKGPVALRCDNPGCLGARLPSMVKG